MQGWMRLRWSAVTCPSPGPRTGVRCDSFQARDQSVSTTPAFSLVEDYGREYLVAALQFVLFKM